MTVVLALLLATAAVPIGATAAGSSSTSTTAACETNASHGAFRTAAAIEAVNESGQAVSTVDNTRVTVEDVPGFVRLQADNPNGYCVSYTVELADDIVSAADLGSIESNDGATEASWRAAQNLSSGIVYTRVTFTLEPGENATFAPSSVRVKSLSWTGTAKRDGLAIVSSVKSLFGSEKLEETEYTIEPTESSSRVTVPLSSEDGRTVEEWHATYELDGETYPVGQDAAAPVYYTEDGSGSSVTFAFNDKSASVEFVADPSWTDSAAYSARSYWSGFVEGKSWLSFGSSTAVVA